MSAPPPRATSLREWESYLSFLSDHELEETYETEPLNRTLTENKSRFGAIPANPVSATITVLPIATRVNALRPDNLKHFDLDRAIADAEHLADNATTVDAVYTALEAFSDFPLRYEGARALVRGRGAPDADILFIGEVPDADEDAAGEAFAGKAGQLTDLILKSLRIEARSHLLPGLFWRPAGSRPATDEDVRLTAPFTRKLIALMQPKRIILLGATAARVVLDTSDGIQKLRGRAHALPGAQLPETPVYASFSPAMLLKQPAAKSALWRDLLEATNDLP